MFRDYVAVLGKIDTLQWEGRVRDLVGLLVASEGPATAVGDFCEACVPAPDVSFARKWLASAMAGYC